MSYAAARLGFLLTRLGGTLESSGGERSGSGQTPGRVRYPYLKLLNDTRAVVRPADAILRSQIGGRQEGWWPWIFLPAAVMSGGAMSISEPERCCFPDGGKTHQQM